MNKIFLIGNLTGDPELRTTPSGVSVCTMNLAVNRRSSSKDDRQTDFFRITAWRQLGETCSRYLSKGRKIAVIGELSGRLYEAKDGTPRMSLEVTADEVEFLSAREQSGYGSQGYSQPQGYPQPYGANQSAPTNNGGHAARQNSWHDGHAASTGNMMGGSFDSGDIPGGFTEISDSDLPF